MGLAAEVGMGLAGMGLVVEVGMDRAGDLGALEEEGAKVLLVEWEG